MTPIGMAVATATSWFLLAECLYNPGKRRDDAYLASGSFITLIGIFAFVFWATFGQLPSVWDY
jgi:hypothetical protein|tara:strand:+ start:468 stop:656 length:189 start_codon:yes stop_codon:yes gene_type:complete